MPFCASSTKDEIEASSQRLMRLHDRTARHAALCATFGGESRNIEHVVFHMQPTIPREAARAATASDQSPVYAFHSALACTIPMLVYD